MRTVKLTPTGVRWSDDLVSWHPITLASRWRPLLRTVERPVRLAQTVLPWLPYLNYFDSLRFADAARSVLGGVDVLYERFGFMGYGGVLLCRQLGIPLLLEVNGHPFDEMRQTHHKTLNKIQRWISFRLTRWMLANTTRVLPSGYGWENRLVETGLLDRTRSRVIWPGVDQVLFSGNYDVNALRERWRINSSFVVTFVGGFYPWQGLERLVRAFSKLLSQIPDATLLLGGDGPLRTKIESEVRQLGYDHHVRFLGLLAQKEVAEILAMTDIGVLLIENHSEFVGMKLFDYMASGTAVIVTAPNRQHPLVNDGETGLVIEPGNEVQLFEALLRLFKDRRLRFRLGAAAQQVVAQGHSWDHRAAEIEELAWEVLVEDNKCPR